MLRHVEVDIQGYDVDSSVIKIARRNAREAGVDHLIHFQERDVKDLNHPKKYGFIITNPPYGERLEDKKDLPDLYRAFGESFKRLDSWSAYMITSYDDAERYFVLTRWIIYLYQIRIMIKSTMTCRND